MYVEVSNAKSMRVNEKTEHEVYAIVEAACGGSPQLRDLFTTDDSELDPETTATMVSYREMQIQLKRKLFAAEPMEPTESLSVTRYPSAMAASWTVMLRSEVYRLAIYAAGEGEKVGSMEYAEAVQQEESVGLTTALPDRQIVKVLSRKLGAMPKDATARMDSLKQQQESIITALSYMEGLQQPGWEMLRAPRLMGATVEGAEGAAQGCLYTLVRKSEGAVITFDGNRLERHQRQEGPDPQRAKLDQGKLLLAVPKSGGGTKKAYMTFEKDASGKAPLVIMGKHACADGRIIDNHAEGDPCIKEMQRTTRQLPAALRAAGEKLEARLALRPSERCPFFRVWSIKKRRLSPCAVGGCLGKIGSCEKGRWNDRGKQLPEDVGQMVQDWEQGEQRKRQEMREMERTAQTQIKEAHINPEDIPVRRSPRQAEKEGKQSEQPEAGSSAGAKEDNKGKGEKGGKGAGDKGKGKGGKGDGKGMGGQSKDRKKSEAEMEIEIDVDEQEEYRATAFGDMTEDEVMRGVPDLSPAGGRSHHTRGSNDRGSADSAGAKRKGKAKAPTTVKKHVRENE